MKRRTDTKLRQVGAGGNGGDFQLTERERLLIANFRRIEHRAQDFILRVSTQFTDSFAAERPRLALVAGGTKGGAS